MAEAELRQLPAAIPLATAFAAFGVGRTTGYALVRAGEFPVEVLNLGGVKRVRTADVLAALGLPADTRAGAA